MPSELWPEVTNMLVEGNAIETIGLLDSETLDDEFKALLQSELDALVSDIEKIKCTYYASQREVLAEGDRARSQLLLEQLAKAREWRSLRIQNAIEAVEEQ